MTRTIVVSGGFSGSVVVDLQDGLRNLEGAQYRLALVPSGQGTPPDAASLLWRDAEVLGGSDGTATLTVPVDSTTPVGTYNLALDVVANGRHEVVWVTGRMVRRRATVAVR